MWLTTEEAETAPHTKQKMLAATLAGHHPLGGPHGKAVAPTGFGLDRRVGAERRAGTRPLPLPLQSMLVEPVLRRIDELARRGIRARRRWRPTSSGRASG